MNEEYLKELIDKALDVIYSCEKPDQLVIAMRYCCQVTRIMKDQDYGIFSGFRANRFLVKFKRIIDDRFDQLTIET